VLGTAFRVEQAGDRVRVAVERGRVRVLRGDQQSELEPGQTVELSPAPVRASVPTPKPRTMNVPPPRSRAMNAPLVDLSPAALLETADRARRSRHPEAAITSLRMLVSRFPSDARAPLAAFTLGLLALERRRPDEAAQSFALARRLDPAGELAEDALAREVQAWYEAGRESTARDRASEYQRLYPRGRRAESVRRLGGLR
jgi:TolA-binding protein